jgi:hypothetical protein
VIWVSTQLGGARLLGEPHCSAPVRSLLQRTLLRGETTALATAEKSTAAHCVNAAR